MTKKNFTEEQIVHACAKPKAVPPSPKSAASKDLIMGVTEQSSYRWKCKFAGLGIAELRRLKLLEEENRKLKALVADLTLDKHATEFTETMQNSVVIDRNRREKRPFSPKYATLFAKVDAEQQNEWG